MTGGRRGASRVVTVHHPSRWPASLLLSVAAHAALLTLLAGSAIVKLDIVPTTIDLAFLDASDRTAGPGETAPELRTAAPSAPAAALPPPDTLREEVPPEPPVPMPEPVVRLEPKPASKPAVKPTTKPLASDPAAPPALSSSPAGTGSAAASESRTPGGTDARSTAPAWAPTARVRYEQLLFAWMDRHKQYPMLAQRRGLEGIGSLRVRIDRGGRVLERAVVETTGEQMLDQAALDMVRRANPFPAVPSEYAGETFEFIAPIQYRLR